MTPARRKTLRRALKKAALAHIRYAILPDRDYWSTVGGAAWEGPEVAADCDFAFKKIKAAIEKLWPEK